MRRRNKIEVLEDEFSDLSLEEQRRLLPVLSGMLRQSERRGAALADPEPKKEKLRTPRQEAARAAGELFAGQASTALSTPPAGALSLGGSVTLTDDHGVFAACPTWENELTSNIHTYCIGEMVVGYVKPAEKSGGGFDAFSADSKTGTLNFLANTATQREAMAAVAALHLGTLEAGS